MSFIRSIRANLSALANGRGFRSLSTVIVMAMCAGLLIPALVGGLVLTNLRQEQTRSEMDRRLGDKINLLANSLIIPVWQIDKTSAGIVAEASLLDPQVVRVTIMIASPNESAPVPFFNLEKPERRIGTSRVVQRELRLNDEYLGDVAVEIDDGLSQREIQKNRRNYSIILLGQFVLALLFILLAIRAWVLKPLARLTDYSSQLASGDFERSIEWERADEIGRLARQLDQMRRELRSAFSEQQAILGNIQVGVMFVKNRTVQLANRYAEHIFGYGPGEMSGLDSRAIYLSDDQYLAIGERAYAAISSDGQYEEELLLNHRQKGAFWARIRGTALESGPVQAGSIWVFEDISLRKAAEEEINSLAFYDPLTQLPNRRLLLDRLKQALMSSQRNGRIGALLFIDLDNFKTLNDTHGHDVGDILLQQVAERLTLGVREGDTVARLGGDEFVVLLENLSENRSEAAAQARGVGEKIIAAIDQPYQLATHECHSTPSIGITLFADSEDELSSVDDLMKQADLALYQAKAAGRNTMRFFDPDMQAIVSARALLDADLHEAVLKRQFVLHYQAQVDCSGRLLGAEALLRWMHPAQGMVFPGTFIGLAEDTGLIWPIGCWVLETACAQLATWAMRPETEDLSIAVNISARQLHHDGFVGHVLATLRRTGAKPQRLKLELTESLLVDDVESAIAKMTILKASGVAFSLDDFGTGFSSLSYLKRLPLDQLKIDQSFVRDVLTDANDASIAKIIVVLAESLGLSVIAEGVETEAQREFLGQNGCRAYQGYLFGRPMRLDDFENGFLAPAPNAVPNIRQVGSK